MEDKIKNNLDIVKVFFNNYYSYQLLNLIESS